MLLLLIETVYYNISGVMQIYGTTFGYRLYGKIKHFSQIYCQQQNIQVKCCKTTHSRFFCHPQKECKMCYVAVPGTSSKNFIVQILISVPPTPMPSETMVKKFNNLMNIHIILGSTPQTGLGSQHLSPVLQACLPYLSCRQPQPLQQVVHGDPFTIIWVKPSHIDTHMYFGTSLKVQVLAGVGGT